VKKGGILKKMKALKLVKLIVCQAFGQFFFIFFLLNAQKGVNKGGSCEVFNQKIESNFNNKMLFINILIKNKNL